MVDWQVASDAIRRGLERHTSLLERRCGISLRQLASRCQCLGQSPCAALCGL